MLHFMTYRKTLKSIIKKENVIKVIYAINFSRMKKTWVLVSINFLPLHKVY